MQTNARRVPEISGTESAFAKRRDFAQLLPDDVLCKILRLLPLSRPKAAVAMVNKQWARCLDMTDSYQESIGRRHGQLALRQSLQFRHGCGSLDDLHPRTVQAEVQCTRLQYTRCFPNLVSLTVVLISHDVCVKFPPASAHAFPQLKELHIDNKGDLDSTDCALEWDLRAMPALKQVACDSLNEAFEWDLHQLPNLQQLSCWSTRMPMIQLPQQCKANLELQLFMHHEAFDSDSPSEVQPWACVESLHLDRLWVGASVIGEHAGMNQRLSLLGSFLAVKHLSLAVHFGDALSSNGGKLIFPSNVQFETCDIYALVHGKHAVENCIGLCERSVELPEGWTVQSICCCTPDAASAAVRGHWKGLDSRYYEPSEQTYLHLQLQQPS